MSRFRRWNNAAQYERAFLPPTTLRRTGVATLLIVALAACSQPTATPAASEAAASTPAALGTVAASARESADNTPEVSEQPSASDGPSGESDTFPAGHTFASVLELAESFEGGFDMFGLGPMELTTRGGMRAFVSESPDGDLVAGFPIDLSRPGADSGVEMIHVVDMSADTETADPLPMWSTMLTALLPDDVELVNYVHEQVFTAFETGDPVEPEEQTFGRLRVQLSVVQPDGYVIIIVRRTDSTDAAGGG